jgi:hypothetical protein
MITLAPTPAGFGEIPVMLPTAGKAPPDEEEPLLDDEVLPLEDEPPELVDEPLLEVLPDEVDDELLEAPPEDDELAPNRMDSPGAEGSPDCPQPASTIKHGATASPRNVIKLGKRTSILTCLQTTECFGTAQRRIIGTGPLASQNVAKRLHAVGDARCASGEVRQHCPANRLRYWKAHAGYRPWKRRRLSRRRSIFHAERCGTPDR